jgi:hypothetical protein
MQIRRIGGISQSAGMPLGGKILPIAKGAG